MKFGKVLLIIGGILFVGFGLCFIIEPVFFSGLFTGETFTTTSAVIDMRATYGGMGLGLGLWLLMCAKDYIRLGLLGSLVVLVSIILGRVVGIVADGDANSFMYVFLAAEIIFLILILIALKKVNE